MYIKYMYYIVGTGFVHAHYIPVWHNNTCLLSSRNQCETKLLFGRVESIINNNGRYEFECDYCRYDMGFLTRKNKKPSPQVVFFFT